MSIVIELIRIILSVMIGIVIGTERRKSGKPVGRRTLALVAMGSTLAAIIAIKYFPTESGRILAGIMTGIGFLGAGAIIATGKDVKGLTTAASVWAIAIVGLTIGIGDYFLGIVVAILMFILLRSHIDAPSKK